MQVIPTLGCVEQERDALASFEKAARGPLCRRGFNLLAPCALEFCVFGPLGLIFEELGCVVAAGDIP
jgi:hypothetical protein